MTQGKCKKLKLMDGAVLYEQDDQDKLTFVYGETFVAISHRVIAEWVKNMLPTKSKHNKHNQEWEEEYGS